MLPPDPPNPEHAQPTPAVPTNAVARRAALANVINVMSIPWVRDFLLDLPPTAEASILASPLQRLHSVSWTTEMLFSDITGGPPMESSLSTSIMIPAFSRDGLTAFTRIEEDRGKTPPPFKRPGFTQGRFVMSELDGSVVFAGQEDKERGIITIFAKQAPNAREQVLQIFIFDAASLRALVKSVTASVAEFEKPLHAAILVHNTRACPICSVSAHGMCGCKLSFGRAQHGLDFSSVQENMIASLGNYAGFGVLELIDNGQVRRVTALGTAWNGVGDAPYGESNRLLSWAITQSLAATVPSVFFPLQLTGAPDSVAEGNRVEHPAPDGMLLDDVDPSLGSFDFSEFPEALLDEAPAVHVGNDVHGAVNPWECINPLQPAEMSVPEQVVPTPVFSSTSEVPLLPTRTQAVPIAPLVPRDNIRGCGTTTKTDLEMKQLRAYQQKIRNRESAARSNLARKKRKEMQKKQQAATSHGASREGLRETAPG